MLFYKQKALLMESFFSRFLNSLFYYLTIDIFNNTFLVVVFKVLTMVPFILIFFAGISLHGVMVSL